MSDIMLPAARAGRATSPLVGSRAGSWGLLLFLKYEKAVGGDASE